MRTQFNERRTNPISQTLRHVLASAHGQKRNQLPKDDLELPDLGGRRVYAPAVYVARALRLADFLARPGAPAV